MRRVSRALAAVVLALVCSCSGGSTGFNPGDKAPEIKGTDSKGNSVALSQYQGKVTLLNFWATWCGPCVGELPNVLKTYEKFHPQGFEIIGISLDQEKDALESFVKKNEMTWPQAFDGKGWENDGGNFKLYSKRYQHHY